MLRTSLAAAALVVLPTAAAAGGFVEAVVGAAVPLADDEHTDSVENSVKLGVRAGGLGSAAALEVGLDYTLADLETESFAGFDFSAYRIRVLLGGRYHAPLGKAGFGFVRAAGGLDVAHLEAEGDVFGVHFERSESDLGFAAELGVGGGVRIGTLTVGAQLALPLGFHFDDDDPDDDEDFDLEYTAVDLDILFTAGARF
jgi:hypothetical protein